jgi:hypothetical protein
MRAWTVGALLLVPALALAQSLGEAARKEAERRKQSQASGKATKVVGQEDLEAARDKRVRETGREAPASSPSAPSPAPSPAADSGASPDASASPADESDRASELDRERENRAAEEARWRQRAAQAIARLDHAQRVYDAVKGHRLVPGEYLVDSQGKAIATSPEELQRIVAQAQEEYEAAQKAYDDLIEAARREGVPPGWLR